MAVRLNRLTALFVCLFARPYGFFRAFARAKTRNKITRRRFLYEQKFVQADFIVRFGVRVHCGLVIFHPAGKRLSRKRFRPKRKRNSGRVRRL
jgi:hypothetical protein